VPFDLRSDAPLNRIVFASFTGANTGRESADRSINPVPEPAAYGSIFPVAPGAVRALRRRRDASTTRS
jgi:hypothetical protein